MATRKRRGSDFEGRESTTRTDTISQNKGTVKKGEQEASLQLQQELETLQQVHSSIKALHHMTVTLHKNLQSVVENTNELKGLNEGWRIFFGQSSS